MPDRKRRSLKFIHITKTGGTTIENLFKQHGHAVGRFHSEYGRWHEPFGDKPTSLRTKHDWFTVVRDPYERVLSEFHCKYAGYGGSLLQSGLHGAFMAGMAMLESSGQGGLTVGGANRFIRRQIKHRGKGLDWHYMPQYVYLTAASGVRLRVIRFEHLREELNRLLAEYGLPFQLGGRRDNAALGQKRLTVEDLDAETIALINHVYHRDFELLGYPLRAPKLSRPAAPADTPSRAIARSLAKTVSDLNGRNEVCEMLKRLIDEQDTDARREVIRRSASFRA